MQRLKKFVMNNLDRNTFFISIQTVGKISSTLNDIKPIRPNNAHVVNPEEFRLLISLLFKLSRYTNQSF